MPITILYQDRNLLLCVKPVGKDSEKEMPLLLQEQLHLPRVFCVHRLDQGVGGVMLYALNGKIAAQLTDSIVSHHVTKEYLAVVSGIPEPAEGEMRDLLYHDARSNKTFVVSKERKGVREAILNYQTLATSQDDALTLVHVQLQTGRSHQIRVQFASRKHPLAGDRRYGSGIHIPEIALWSHRLSLEHPVSHQPLTAVSTPPDTDPWTLFDIPD